MEQGKMKFEYRKQLPKEDCIIYFYVSSPIKAISGIAYCGAAEPLTNWVERYKDKPTEIRKRIDYYLTDCNYVIPIYKFQNTNYIKLDQLKKDIPGCNVPRMYFFINDTPLEEYTL